MSSLKNYLTITFAYWSFTLTDGALRMLVVLYFHQIGYSPLSIAFLFLFYEFFGVITNLIGGWIASRYGLNKTLFAGIGLQVLSLYLLSIESWLGISFVMFVQALSGIAKDLNKMSAKSSIKHLVSEDQPGQLFKWVAILTGSKNALKGIGFFLGGLLLSLYGFTISLQLLAGCLLLVGLVSFLVLVGKANPSANKPKFTELWSKSAAINWLSAARFFLFGARDIWFVIALPVFLQSQMNWSHAQVGSLLALWIILYGIVQSMTPKVLGFADSQRAPSAAHAKWYGLLLLLPLITIYWLYQQQLLSEFWLVAGLICYALIFAINSAIHSFLILNYSSQQNVSLDVGFYYMSNAAGRLVGTLLSGWLFQTGGLAHCLIGSAIMILACAAATFRLDDLPRH